MDREFEVLKAPSLGAGQLAAAHNQDDRLDESAFAVDSEHVLVDSPMMQHGLPLDGFFDRADAVADSRRLLELQAGRMRLHLIAHLMQQFEVLALEQHLRRVQMAPVFVAIDRQTARAEASLDLILEAWARAVAEHRVGAGAERKDFADDVDRLAQAVSRAERAEVVAAVLNDFARDRDSRPRVVGDLGAESTIYRL